MRGKWRSGPTRVVTFAVVTLTMGGVVLGGCGEGDLVDPPVSTGSAVSMPTGYSRPDETVSVLVEMLAAERFHEAARITVEGQMALVALAEGADLETVSDYLRLGELGVGANFWSGFTQVTEEFLAGSIEDLQVVSQRAYEEGQRSFVDFHLAPSTASEDRIFKLTAARSGDRLWRVDVITTFVDVLAHRLSETAEIARATRTEDAAVVHEELARHVPSLLAALTDPELSDEARQGIQSALAAIQ